MVFGTAIGSRIQEVEGVSYGAFIVPGLIMLSVVMLAITNASFGIYFPKFLGTIYELLSAPVNFIEIVIGYVGAAATKSLFVGLVILVTATFLCGHTYRAPLGHGRIPDPDPVSAFRCWGLSSGSGPAISNRFPWCPQLVVTPLIFLGGTFYSISMLPPLWQTITLFNPVVYLISGFRWSFYGLADVPITFSLLAILAFTGICLGIIGWIFKTGWRIRS